MGTHFTVSVLAICASVALIFFGTIYIRLEEEFICPAVIPDAYSRRVIGWSLADTMAESPTVTALKMALSEREVPPGLVHHDFTPFHVSIINIINCIALAAASL